MASLSSIAGHPGNMVKRCVPQEGQKARSLDLSRLLYRHAPAQQSEIDGEPARRQLIEQDHELELAMDKSSSGWKKRPAWVRAIFFGSGRIRMDSHQHLLVERFAVVAGTAFVILGLFFADGTIVAESARVPMLVCASLMYLSAYLMSLFIRIGNEYAVWPWVDAKRRPDA